MRIAHNFAQLSEVKLHYAEAGAGKPFVFLHGFPDYSYMWKDQLLGLANQAYAFAPDFRGFNLSSKPENRESYQLLKLVQDLKEFIQVIEEDKIILVGHGWGGAVAWAFAALHPQFLDKLVVISALHPRLLTRAKYFSELIKEPDCDELFRADDFAILREAFLEPGINEGYFQEFERKRYRNVWSRPGVLTGMLNHLRANSSEVDELVGVVEVDTHLLWGEKNSIIFSENNVQRLKQWAPNLHLQILPETGHWVVQEQPEVVLKKLKSLI